MTSIASAPGSERDIALPPLTRSSPVVGLRDVRFRLRDARLFELALGLSVPFWRFPVIAGIPGEIFMMIIVVGAGIFVRPRVLSPKLFWFGLLYAGMIASAVLVSISAGEPWTQRTLRLMLLLAFALAIAGGRLDWRSLVAGAILGLLVNTGAFYLHLTPNRYPPYLTGWLSDKNVAGLYYAVFGMLALALAKRWWSRLGIVAVFACTIWLTGSRTSLAAFAAALLWWVLRNRLPLLLRLLAFVGGILLLNLFETEFSQVGPFADRTGTDLLRGTIHAAEAVKVAATPWYGQGLNTAWVSIRNFPHMWFHDSYAALYVEGGVVMVAVMLFFVGISGIGLFSVRRRVSTGLRAAEAALIVVLVAAWQLGEVFYTSAALLALGVAWYERFGVPIEPRPQFPG